MSKLRIKAKEGQQSRIATGNNNNVGNFHPPVRYIRVSSVRVCAPIPFLLCIIIPLSIKDPFICLFCYTDKETARGGWGAEKSRGLSDVCKQQPPFASRLRSSLARSHFDSTRLLSKIKDPPLTCRRVNMLVVVVTEVVKFGKSIPEGVWILEFSEFWIQRPFFQFS